MWGLGHKLWCKYPISSLTKIILIISSSLARIRPSQCFWEISKVWHELLSSLLLKLLFSDGRVFNSLFYYSEQFSPQFIARLEDRISDVVEEITPGERIIIEHWVLLECCLAGDLVMILGQMGRKKRRNVPLLKTMSFYIFKHKNMGFFTKHVRKAI